MFYFIFLVLFILFVNTRTLLLILHNSIQIFIIFHYLRRIHFLNVEFYLFHFPFQCFFFIFIFLLHFNVSTFISKHVFFSFIFHSPPPLSRIVVVIIPFHFMPDFCYSLHETRKRIPCMSIHPPLSLSFLPRILFFELFNSIPYSL